jgi:hypothetical protein
MNSVGRILLQALILGALANAPAYAQSEFAGEPFPYRAFDRLPKTTIAIGGGTLDVGFAAGAFTLPRSALMAWLERSAKAASVYFRKFPVSSARILIVPAPGSDVKGARLGVSGAPPSGSLSAAR